MNRTQYDTQRKARIQQLVQDGLDRFVAEPVFALASANNWAIAAWNYAVAAAAYQAYMLTYQRSYDTPVSFNIDNALGTGTTVAVAGNPSVAYKCEQWKRMQRYNCRNGRVNIELPMTDRKRLQTMPDVVIPPDTVPGGGGTDTTPGGHTDPPPTPTPTPEPTVSVTVGGTTGITVNLPPIIKIKIGL